MRASSDPRLAPLVFATMASQALLVVLSPTIVAIADDLSASVSAVGQARAVTATVAIATSAFVAPRLDAVGVRRLLLIGAAVALGGCLAVAAAPLLAIFLAGHVLVGVGFACLLSAAFAGVAAFPPEERARAMGYVAGANALAWIVVNPLAALATDLLSWRAAQAAPALLAAAGLLTATSAASVSPRSAPLRLAMVVRDPSARRWIEVELIAYGSWTALLTFVGAFFIQELDAGQGAVGWYLAAGAAAYFLAATRSEGLILALSRRRLIAASAVAMALLLALQLSLTGSLALSVVLFCLIGLAAGVRTPASSGLGLEQLPESPGAMMSARTGATQLGYLLGAAAGGAVIAGFGYAALGIALAAGMVISAILVLGVRDPLEETNLDDGRSR